MMKKKSIAVLLLITILDYHKVRAFVTRNGITNPFQPVFHHSSMHPTEMDKGGLIAFEGHGSSTRLNSSILNNKRSRYRVHGAGYNRCLSHGQSTTMCNMLVDGSLLYSTPDLIATAAIVTEQSIEAEILGDFAHLCLDFATFFSPDTVVLRLFVVCGRVCAILSDYIPDGKMTPDEVFVQFAMLGLSCRNFFVKFSKIIASANKTSSFRDRRIYQCIFRPAGFSWTQYLALMNDALEWIDVPEGTIVSEQYDNLLIVYRGLLCAKQNTYRGGNKERQREMLFGKRNGRSSHDVIGDLSSLTRLTAKERMSMSPTFGKPCDGGSNDTGMDRNVQEFQALGGCGASLLRINTERLFEVARKDSYMAECTKNLFFHAAQDRLRYYEPDINIDSGSSSDSALPLSASASSRSPRARSDHGIDDAMRDHGASNQTVPYQYILRV